MSRSAIRRWLYLVLGIAFVLHQDLWLWDDPRRWLGLPAGLTYHILFCVAVSGIMALLVGYAWPSHLDDEGGSGIGR